MTICDSVVLARSILRQSCLDSGFADFKAYSKNEIEGMSYFILEAEIIRRFDDNYLKGQEFTALLYSYRSCSRAIPQGQSADPATKEAIYAKIVDILSPEIVKIKQFQIYCESTLMLVSESLKTLSGAVGETRPSEGFIWCLARMLDMFLIIDAIKNMKTSLNNDFSMFKRALTFLKMDTNPELMNENQRLYIFLANHDYLLKAFKESLSKIEKADEIFLELIDVSVEMLERRDFVGDHKHLLLKALAASVFLIDLAGEDREKKKKTRVEKVLKVIKANPIVPLFGDMPIVLSSLLKKSSGDMSKIEYSRNDESLLANYILVHKIEAFQNRFSAFMKDIRELLALNTEKPSAELSSNVYRILLSGLVLVSNITNAVLEQNAWKYANPTNFQINPACPNEAGPYELALYMIHSVSSILTELDGKYLGFIDESIFLEIQKFVVGPLKDGFAHLQKKKKSSAFVLKAVIDFFGFVDDETVLKSRTWLKTAPSLTQLHFGRSLLYSVFNDRAKGMKATLMKEKDLKDNVITEFAQFNDDAVFFPYMTDFRTSLRKSCNLSELWFKEFYLELTKQIQFPIEMSLPWMLISHVLESNQYDKFGMLLLPLEIHNDASERALVRLKSRYLYDEIEAEVNLCFDQLIFKLGSSLFESCRMQSVLTVLTRESRIQVFGYDINSIRQKLPICYDSVFGNFLNQRAINILGRYIDLRKIISQNAAIFLRTNMEQLLTKLESCPITEIFEFRILLQSLKTTHSLLSQYLYLESFEDLWDEIKDCNTFLALNDRMWIYLATEILFDIVPNYSYNSVSERFIPSLFQTSQYTRAAPPKGPSYHFFGSKALNNAANEALKIYKEVISGQNFVNFFEVAGTKSLHLVVKEMGKYISALIKDKLVPYLEVLCKAYPSDLKLPLFEYGSKGAMQYFIAKLEPIISYSALKFELLAIFREIGNSYLLVQMLESSMVTYNINGQNLREKEVAGERKNSLKKLFCSQLNDGLQVLSTEMKNCNILYHKIWSVINLASMTDYTLEQGFPILYYHGDGMYFGGHLLLYLLEENNAFQIHDLAAHVNYVSASEDLKDPNRVRDQMIDVFLDRFYYSDRVMRELDCYFPLD